MPATHHVDHVTIATTTRGLSTGQIAPYRLIQVENIRLVSLRPAISGMRQIPCNPAFPSCIHSIRNRRPIVEAVQAVITPFGSGRGTSSQANQRHAQTRYSRVAYYEFHELSPNSGYVCVGSDENVLGPMVCGGSN